MYSVYQHWDPLEVCIVGASYPPEFYSFITNSRVRLVMERIAQETEEDYQELIKLLTRFGVEVLRPEVGSDWRPYYNQQANKINSPPMYPRDYSLMLGNRWFWRAWPTGGSQPLPDTMPAVNHDPMWHTIVTEMKQRADRYITGPLACPDTLSWDGAMLTRVGKDLYHGTHNYKENTESKLAWLNANLPEYRHHIVNTGGHSDGVFCVVKPGLIISTYDIESYAESFPGWEVVYIPNTTGDMQKFNEFKNKNHGKWWVPGEELNDDFTDFVESWLGHWMGYAEETVFDVNMLMLDPDNIAVTAYNETLFRKFEQHGITPHIVNLRHRYFWDGGLHCCTSDVSRRGTLQDFF